MSLRVVIIGAVAAGPKAGCRLKRLMPDAHVILVDKDEIISYGGCGIPYYVGGDVGELEGLRTTSFHMVRDEEFFKGAKGIDVLAGWKAEKIDSEVKEVTLTRVKDGEKKTLAYDKLVLATGSRPSLPPLPGLDLEGVLPVADLHQAEFIKNSVAKGRVERAAVLGTGPTGLEMAEALADLWGVEVDIFEIEDQLLPGLLDPDLARFAQNHLEEQEGIEVFLNTRVQGFGDDGEGRVKTVRFIRDGQEEERASDLVIMATGVRPRDDLAGESGLRVSDSGGILVDEFLRTSDPDIFASGDCLAQNCLIGSGEKQLASGSVANRQGRVVGTNLAAETPTARFRGVSGTWIMKLFELTTAKAGLTYAQARDAGFDPVAGLVVQADRAHFYPDHELMYLKLIADRKTRKILGIQGVGPHGDALAGRINAVAATLPFGPVLEDISNLELAYAPPYAAAMDILNAAANTVENILEGRLESLSPEEFSARLNDPKDDTVFLDVRGEANAKPYLEALSDRGWRHLPQETLADRLDEIPRDKPLILVCNAGARSYEAQVTLKAAGFKNTVNLSGGVAAAKKWGEPIIPEE